VLIVATHALKLVSKLTITIEKRTDIFATTIGGVNPRQSATNEAAGSAASPLTAFYSTPSSTRTRPNTPNSFIVLLVSLETTRKVRSRAAASPRGRLEHDRRADYETKSRAIFFSGRRGDSSRHSQIATSHINSFNTSAFSHFHSPQGASQN